MQAKGFSHPKGERGGGQRAVRFEREIYPPLPPPMRARRFPWIRGTARKLLRFS